MTNDNKNVFSFYLDESLWFERGQEVKELMGISLDPEIVIHPLDETVLIQGAINLTGEYFAKTDEESDTETVAPFPSRKIVERVEQEEEGASQFYHQFPVEVSIPRNRVENVDDVSVSIDVFDYELPSENQLKLHATIAIHGIEETEREKEGAAESEARSENNVAWEQSYQFEVDYPENDEASASPEANTSSFEQENPVMEEEVVESKSESSSGDRWKYKKVQTLSEFFNHEAAPEVEENEPSPSPSYEASPSLEYKGDEVEGQDDEGETEAESRNLGNQLLFSMFEDREETYTKMKMCIVQEEDTLESIADRYQISITHLTKVNNVFEDDLKPGKIIYIPSQS
ncbi:stage VI sporulation protein D [Thalassobacillus devorans]|uniref:stage VI sporulation protein D n=1 Tax=Thalassobacillus devorans TaxID=279813 RepID=UPI00048FA461|nr:stage VI sporulation protein D [Thalassobacillus devorans]